MSDERIDKVVPDFTGPLPEYLPDGPGPVRRRSRVLIVLLLLTTLYAVGLEVSAVRCLSRPSAGFRYYHLAMAPEVRIDPLTRAAERAVEGMSAPLVLLEANGRGITRLPIYQFIHSRQHYLDEGLGRTNRFLVRGRGGQRREVSMEVEYPTIRVVVRHTHKTLAFKLVGLFYFFITLLVWWLRPEDRAAGPLMILGMVALVNMSYPLALTAGTVPLLALSLAVMPLWGLAGVNLAVQFVGAAGHQPLRKFFRLLAALIGLTCVTLFVSLPLSLTKSARSYSGWLSLPPFFLHRDLRVFVPPCEAKGGLDMPVTRRLF